mgnify:FL=1
MRHTDQKRDQLFLLLFGMLAVYFLVYAFTGCWPWSENPYNSYVLQTRSWLFGRMDLGQNYSHLELAEYGGKYYVSFPPVPSVVLLPFVILRIPDNFAALLVSLLNGFFAWRLYRRESETLFWSAFLLLGGNLIFISVNAWVWFFAQNLCVLFSLAACDFALRRNGTLSLLFWALSVGCRPFQILYLPVLLYLLYRRTPDRKIRWEWWIAPVLIAAAMALYNYARFGSFLEFGHNYLPEFTESRYGQFSLHYIPDNFRTLFRLPQINPDGTLSFPIFNGFAVWLASPIVLACLWYAVREVLNGGNYKMVFLFFGTFLAHLLCLTAHKTMGGFQFGHRYTIDLLPYAYTLLLLTKKKVSAKYWTPAFLFGFGLNLIGTVGLYCKWI